MSATDTFSEKLWVNSVEAVAGDLEWLEWRFYELMPITGDPAPKDRAELEAVQREISEILAREEG